MAVEEAVTAPPVESPVESPANPFAVANPFAALARVGNPFAPLAASPPPMADNPFTKHNPFAEAEREYGRKAPRRRYRRTIVLPMKERPTLWYLPVEELFQPYQMAGYNYDQWDTILEMDQTIDFSAATELLNSVDDGDEDEEPWEFACLAAPVPDGVATSVLNASEMAYDQAATVWTEAWSAALAVRAVAQDQTYRLVSMMETSQLFELLKWGESVGPGFWDAAGLRDILLRRLVESQVRSMVLDYVTWVLPGFIEQFPTLPGNAELARLLGEPGERMGRFLTTNEDWLPSRPEQRLFFTRFTWRDQHQDHHLVGLADEYEVVHVGYVSAIEHYEGDPMKCEPGVIGWRLVYVEPYATPDLSRFEPQP